MDRSERFYKIDKLLRERRVTSKHLLLETIGISSATLKRDLAYLRDRFNAPIIWDRERQGYRYDEQPGQRFALPGLWFNSDELHALLTIEQLLNGIQPDLLRPHIEPLRQRIHSLLEKSDHSWEEVNKRVKIIPLASRSVAPIHLTQIADALLTRRRLNFDYRSRYRGQHTRREVSPQRLIYYRDNWYLDAWCHLRDGLRSFALEMIKAATILNTSAQEIDSNKLDAELGSGYGIFSGCQTQTAILRFTPERAGWVAKEKWHPQQQSRWLEDGRYELRIPYSDPRELVMDILKYGPDVEVMGPPALRQTVISRLASTLDHYGRK